MIRSGSPVNNTFGTLGTRSAVRTVNVGTVGTGALYGGVTGTAIGTPTSRYGGISVPQSPKITYTSQPQTFVQAAPVQTFVQAPQVQTVVQAQPVQTFVQAQPVQTIVQAPPQRVSVQTSKTFSNNQLPHPLHPHQSPQHSFPLPPP